MEATEGQKLPPRVKDLTGMRFHRLTVVGFAGFCVVEPNGKRRSRWTCSCDCGNTTAVRTAALTQGHSTSCGCRKRETAARIGKANTKHGHYMGGKHSRTGKSWGAMVRRCEIPRHKSFPDYGGRGIQICEGLRTFEGFLSVMGERPEGMTLDRIDPNGMYSCGGCGHCVAEGWTRNTRWATPAQQVRNRRPRSHWRRRSDPREAA
jgi:hypothetical protein